MLIQIGVKVYVDKYFIGNGFVSAFFFSFHFNQTTQKYLSRAGQNLNNYSGIQRILC